MSFLEILKVIFLGIVEGITEWLPISSTGHMILVNEFIKLDGTLGSGFMEMFLVVIQLGAILAVIFIYWNKIFPFHFKEKPIIKPDIMTLWFKILVACVPAGIIGIKFNDEIDKLFYNYVTVSITLIVYGVLFIVIENYNRGRKPQITKLSDISYKTAAFIGVFQVLSLIPGTSRSGTTILGAILIGTSRFVATEFTFFLAIPIMFGASFIKLIKFGFQYTPNQALALILGILTAFVVSVFAIKFLVGFIKKHNFKVFGYYRIILGLLVIMYFVSSTFM